MFGSDTPDSSLPFRQYPHSPPLAFQPAGRPQLHHIRQVAMFDLVYPLQQRILIVILMDRNDLLKNDGAGVVAGIGEMDGDAGDLYTAFQGIANGVGAGKRRQQRRVQIDDGVRIRVKNRRPYQSHVAGEYHQIDPVFPQPADYLLIILIIRVVRLSVNPKMGNSMRLGSDETVSIRAAADDHSDRRRHGARGASIDNGLQVRAAPGDQDANNRFLFIV